MSSINNRNNDIEEDINTAVPYAIAEVITGKGIFDVRKQEVQKFIYANPELITQARDCALKVMYDGLNIRRVCGTKPDDIVTADASFFISLPIEVVAYTSLMLSFYFRSRFFINYKDSKFTKEESSQVGLGSFKVEMILLGFDAHDTPALVEVKIVYQSRIPLKTEPFYFF